MAQMPPQLVYKQTEQAIVNAINDALQNGLPMFVIEPMVKIIFTEIQQTTKQQYDEAQTAYQQAIIEEQQKAEAENETTSA